MRKLWPAPCRTFSIRWRNIAIALTDRERLFSQVDVSAQSGFTRARPIFAVASAESATSMKFDRVQKRIYWMQTLSEPLTDLPKMSKDICDAVGMNLELKADAMWRIR